MTRCKPRISGVGSNWATTTAPGDFNLVPSYDEWRVRIPFQPSTSFLPLLLVRISTTIEWSRMSNWICGPTKSDCLFQPWFTAGCLWTDYLHRAAAVAASAVAKTHILCLLLLTFSLFLYLPLSFFLSFFGCSPSTFSLTHNMIFFQRTPTARSTQNLCWFTHPHKPPFLSLSFSLYTT